MIAALLLIPAMAGLASFVIRPNWPRRTILLAAALAHTVLVVAAWIDPPSPVLHGWMAIDDVSLLFLTIASVLFLAAAVYGVGYLANEGRHARSADDDLPFVNFPEATFVGCMLLFLATMTLVVVSRHFGLMWVAVEATTLASAPLVYFHRCRRSLEATWKYLVICSVGIALALLGNFFLAVATRSCDGPPIHLTMDDLMTHARSLDARWLQGAFLLFLVGYGTKMGLAPLHTWLPDAHSEAPSVVSALLSGALLNCAFLTILRGHALLAAAGHARFSCELLILFGLISMSVAAVFILGQADFKRMLAYSSVEHMGILSLGIGIGGVAAFGAMFHAVNHSLAKAMLFLLAGNMLAVYRSKSTVDTRGVLQRMPVTGALLIVGFFAIAGSPPFGLFVSELTILQGAVNGGHWVAATIFLLALFVIFVGMATIVLNMAYGAGRETATVIQPSREPFWSTLPPMALLAASLVLGVYVPPALSEVMQRAAAVVGAN